ncbi:DNA polymerase III subunit psi [Enterovibrio nigricans]|uniref:DNA polymerase III subunit psi n=1 Tax=Enterovibrio nigricans DSM 22720 TaxID=1121868 RepID=A0A1T4TT64_9GAMM|nr:DNA polymerase III subunit psi [Enterovibrio nigricans]PKF51885.1 DNA polymerase III subunit psi [Enterovibrio nigricans]SKA43379.1 DNA polymerase III, psi subunit [Enterovibrio nigricans DSM 22720]
MNDLQRLNEMGITVWDVRRTGFFPNQKAKAVALPASCKLLLVCESQPDEQDAELFGKILSSMKLSPEEALRVQPEVLSAVSEHSLEWCWFAGCEGEALSGTKKLTSPSLSMLQHDQNAKKVLWHQIKTL